MEVVQFDEAPFQEFPDTPSVRVVLAVLLDRRRRRRRRRLPAAAAVAFGREPLERLVQRHRALIAINPVAVRDRVVSGLP